LQSLILPELTEKYPHISISRCGHESEQPCGVQAEPLFRRSLEIDNSFLRSGADEFLRSNAVMRSRKGQREFMPGWLFRP